MESEDSLKKAGQAFEEHERELLDQLMARAQRDIPAGATVGEAITEIRRAISEDDDARELLFRVSVVQSQNSGYIRSHFEESARLADSTTRYTSAIGGQPVSREALDLMKRLGEEIDRRLPTGLSEAEREARVVELLKEDEELARMASHLELLWDGSGALPPPDHQ